MARKNWFTVKLKKKKKRFWIELGMKFGSREFKAISTHPPA